MLRKIRLYGSLAKFVGARVLEADISTAAEAVRFLAANFEGLEQHMADKHYRVITHTSLTTDELHDITNVETIKIVPVVAGSGPVGRILAGIALIAISFFVPFVAPILFGLGASLVLGGVAQLITPVPKIAQGEDSVSDTKRSYNFSGIQQTSRAGTPVPLVYGKTLVGSVVISAGISDEVQVAESAPPPIIARSGQTLTAPNVCEIRSIQWFRNGVAIPGATNSTYTLQSEDYETSITATIVCFDRSVVTTEVINIPFEPTLYTYWRARRDSYITGWASTATSYPYWATPFNPDLQPVSQPWFGGGTITVGPGGSVGGALAEMYGKLINSPGIGVFYTYWSGAVTFEDPFEIGTPFTFDFSNDGVTVARAGWSADDISPPR